MSPRLGPHMDSTARSPHKIDLWTHRRPNPQNSTASRRCVFGVVSASFAVSFGSSPHVQTRHGLLICLISPATAAGCSSFAGGSVPVDEEGLWIPWETIAGLFLSLGSTIPPNNYPSYEMPGPLHLLPTGRAEPGVASPSKQRFRAPHQGTCRDRSRHPHLLAVQQLASLS